MKPSLLLLSSLVAAFAATSACSVERSSTVLGPSTTTAAAAGTSAPSLIGTWVVTGPATSATPSAVSALPDFSSCRNFTWEVTTQTSTDASGRFSAECGNGLVLSGTIAGRLASPASIPIIVNGSLNRASDTCTFSLTGEGQPVNSVTFHITYAGNTCLGPLQGSNTLSLAPHSAPAPSPTGYTLTGTLTDGTSGGVLPGIEVRAGEFLAVRTDSAGHY